MRNRKKLLTIIYPLRKLSGCRIVISTVQGNSGHVCRSSDLFESSTELGQRLVSREGTEYCSFTATYLVAAVKGTNT